MKPETAFNSKSQMLKPGFKFKDITFYTHGMFVTNGGQACVEFKNGHWASIIGCPWKIGCDHPRLYGDGVNTFEILSSVSETKSWCVKSWQTKKQVMNHLKYLEKKEEI